MNFCNGIGLHSIVRDIFEDTFQPGKGCLVLTGIAACNGFMTVEYENFIISLCLCDTVGNITQGIAIGVIIDPDTRDVGGI